ncbi:MAG: hypothetical protein K8U57_20590 [Planctomycetes bacterium]|nr:hypothetical protein [Planctomycetota bacterium]
MDVDSGAHQGVDGLPGSDPCPSSTAAARKRDAALERAIARLSVEYRQVLVWRNRERLSYAEIGGLLNRSAEAARKLWCRAVELLLEELGPESCARSMQTDDDQFVELMAAFDEALAGGRADDFLACTPPPQLADRLQRTSPADHVLRERNRSGRWSRISRLDARSRCEGLPSSRHCD